MTTPIRIPADVDMQDQVLGPLTARQLAILTAAGGVLYLIWATTRTLVPLPVFAALAIPVGAASVMLAMGTRDGASMDRLLVAAIRQRLNPCHRVAAPEGVRPAPDWLASAATQTDAPNRGSAQPPRPQPGTPAALRLPAQAITETGVVDLGADGLALVAVASTVNFALRTPTEQQALVASFGRYLHSLTAPIQVLVRTEHLDLSAQVAELRQRAGGLPHPALEAAAVEHADYLVQLGEQSDLLRRQVLLVLREPLDATVPTDGLGGPGPLAVLTAIAARRRRPAGEQGNAGARRAAEARLVRRLSDAIELLSPAGIVVTPLDAGQTTAVLASACNPDRLLPPSPDLAGADDIITTSGPDPAEHDDVNETPFLLPATAGRSGLHEAIDDWNHHDEDERARS